MTIIAISEVLVFFGIVILLLYIEPLGALIVGSVIGIVVLILNINLKKYFVGWGEKQIYYGAQIKQHLLQGLGGIKEVKILGREKNFLSLFYTHVSENTKINIIYNFLNSLPRLFFEFL